MTSIKTKIITYLYKHFAKPIFFQFKPDFIHQQMLNFGSKLGVFAPAQFLTKQLFYYENPALELTISGIKFKNPVGLSEGFDKDADLLNILPYVGFGYQQIGTVTYEAYEGNPKPWSTRLIKSRAITVNYGLKSIGASKVIEKIKGIGKLKYPISISIGKTNAHYTDNIPAGVTDYINCLNEFLREDLGDIYTLNISCPNTFGGEPFTTPESLEPLLQEIAKLQIKKPILLKMPINLPWAEFKVLCEIAIKYNVTGMIIGNLNKDRKDPAILDVIPAGTKGSISGKPTERLSNMLISETYKAFGKKLLIIGVGGIFSAEDAYEKIRRGATLVQLITGMVYVGPQLVGAINQGLVEFLKRDGFKNISEAVGTKHKD